MARATVPPPRAPPCPRRWPSPRPRSRCASHLATIFPCAYELTAHINPRSEHTGRHDARTSDTSFAAAVHQTRHGWHHGARQAARKARRRTNPDAPPRPRRCAALRFCPRYPCRAPISGAACAISPGNPSLCRSSRPSSPPAPPRMSSGRRRCAGRISAILMQQNDSLGDSEHAARARARGAGGRALARGY